MATIKEKDACYTYNTLARMMYKKTYRKGECAVQYHVAYKEVKWFRGVYNRVNR